MMKVWRFVSQAACGETLKLGPVESPAVDSRPALSTSDSSWLD